MSSAQPSSSSPRLSPASAQLSSAQLSSAHPSPAQLSSSQPSPAQLQHRSPQCSAAHLSSQPSSAQLRPAPAQYNPARLNPAAQLRSQASSAEASPAPAHQLTSVPHSPAHSCTTLLDDARRPREPNSCGTFCEKLFSPELRARRKAIPPGALARAWEWPVSYTISSPRDRG